MTDTKDTQIKVEDTIENLNHNFNVIHAETKKHEQCMLAATTLINHQVDTNGFEELLAALNDQAENLSTWSNFVCSQYNRIHCGC